MPCHRSADRVRFSSLASWQTAAGKEYKKMERNSHTGYAIYVRIYTDGAVYLRMHAYIHISISISTRIYIYIYIYM